MPRPRIWLSCLLLSAFACLSAQAAPTKKVETIRLAGPTAIFSLPLLHMLDSGALDAYAEHVEFRQWDGPDQLRALLLQGQIDYSAAPVILPALLRNRGEPVRLLNTSVWNVVWLISRDPKVKGFADLRGETVLSPIQREFPGLLLNEVLGELRLEAGKDIHFRALRSGPDAIALMQAKQAEHILLVEPAASLLLQRNRQQGGAPLYRVQSLEQAWAQVFPDAAQLPIAGLMASRNVADDSELNTHVADAYAQSARWCAQQPRACAELAHRHWPHMPVEALEEAIGTVDLDLHSARDFRPQLQALYARLLRQSPELIGGQLPDDGLYGP